MSALDSIHDWPVDNAAAAVIVGGEWASTVGDVDRPFALASVTKLLTAMTALIAHEEGTLGLDEPVTQAGATSADLLAHSAGLAPDANDQLTPPHRRRIYSTSAYDLLATTIASRAAMSFEDYATAAVVDPLEMTATRVEGSAGAGAWSTVRDLISLVRSWRTPTLIHADTLDRATTPHLPDLAGVLPGYGRHEPNPWGLGPEIRGHKHPHWTGSANSARTYGHFGQLGTLLWIDPAVDVALVVLTDRAFGEWTTERWPSIADAVLHEVDGTTP